MKKEKSTKAKKTKAVDTESMSKSEKINYVEELRKKEKEVYCRGKDSALIVSGKLSKELYGTTSITSQSDVTLEKVNKKYHWKYTDWETLSCNETLTEEFLDRYQDDVSWYFYLKNHPTQTFSDAFIKRHPEAFRLRILRLV